VACVGVLMSLGQPSKGDIYVYIYILVIDLRKGLKNNRENSPHIVVLPVPTTNLHSHRGKLPRRRQRAITSGIKAWLPRRGSIPTTVAPSSQQRRPYRNPRHRQSSFWKPRPPMRGRMRIGDDGEDGSTN
jgi:hypothetical protein